MRGYRGDYRYLSHLFRRHEQYRTEYGYGCGKFNLAGSIIGAYTIQAITTTLYALGVSSAQAPVFKAIVVILIVVIQSEPVKEFFKKLSANKTAAKEA